MKFMPEHNWSRFLSLEILGSLFVTAVLVGISWGALNADVNATEAKVHSVEKEQKTISADVNKIQRDIDVMKNEQKHMGKDVKETKEDIKHIRTLLEQQYNK